MMMNWGRFSFGLRCGAPLSLGDRGRGFAFGGRHCDRLSDWFVGVMLIRRGERSRTPAQSAELASVAERSNAESKPAGLCGTMNLC
jgi:hypothetical protein